MSKTDRRLRLELVWRKVGHNQVFRPAVGIQNSALPGIAALPELLMLAR